jgi:hypothetical protein
MIRDMFEDSFSDNINELSSNDTTYAFVDHSSEKDCLDWLNKDIKDKVKRSRRRLDRINQLKMLFKGINYRSTSETNARNNVLVSANIKPKDAKIFVNFINEMVEAKCSQRARFKPAIAILPNNDELKDMNNAQSCKQVLDCKAQEMDFEKIFSDGDKIQFLGGESYTFVLWDKAVGGAMPVQIAGKTDAMRGDFKVFPVGPSRAFPQIDKDEWENVSDISYIEWVHIDELKALHPKKKNEIKPTDDNWYWDGNKTDKKNHAMVVHYFYKVDRFMPKGAYVKYTMDCVLEKEDLTVKYKHGKLPVVFDTDIDIDEELHGRPFTDNLTRLQALHNMAMASIAKGFAISANPKWVAPQGSVAINKLTQEYGLMEFKGATPPQLVTFNGVNPSAWNILDKSDAYIKRQGSTYGISLGEPPPGVKAAIALQFLDEQELQRESRGMAKRQRRILDVYRLCLLTMAQHYTPEDGRIYRMLGADNSYLIKTFNLEGVENYEIREQNSSALPDSKSGRIATITEINMATPEDPFFGREEIASMLMMGNDTRFRDKMTISVKAADTVIQRILNGEVNLEPNEWDDFVVQYPIFLRALQERQFKDSEKGVSEELVAYITSMELLMQIKAQSSPGFAARLQTFYMFPVFMTVPAQIPPPPGMEQVQPVDKKQDMSNIAENNNELIAAQKEGEMA